MNNYGTKILETKRLILRRFVLEDTEQMYKNWASDENVTKYFGFEPDKSITVTKTKIECYLKEYEKDNTYIWAIQEKSNNELIGSINADVPYKFLQICEVAYSIGAKWWNNGYTTEALIEVIRYLLIDEDMHLIEAKHNIKNIASGKVLLKAGMTKDATLRERRINKVTGERDDLVVYSIIKAEINN
jgi:ribosomal-protein-alanine N-acetyltransferase